MLQPLHIAMWSGPRNISTAMLRSWGNRPDTFVDTSTYRLRSADSRGCCLWAHSYITPIIRRAITASRADRPISRDCTV